MPRLSPQALPAMVADSSDAEAETIIIRAVAPAGHTAGETVSLPVRVSHQALASARSGQPHTIVSLNSPTI
jgi:hypothetical protein